MVLIIIKIFNTTDIINQWFKHLKHLCDTYGITLKNIYNELNIFKLLILKNTT